jgi:tight adherence protein B
MNIRRYASSALAGLTLAGLIFTGSSAQAADEATIGHVEMTDDGLKILVSVPAGSEVDLQGVKVSVDGKSVPATASPAADDNAIKRTTILAIDTSKSMKGERFAAAQIAAKTFLDTVPDDVYVGITTFAGEVTEALPPTLDRDEARDTLNGLELSKETRLYDGVITAVAMAGADGQRTLVVLSDGADTSKTPLADVTSAISDAEILVDVVALDRTGKGLEPLQKIAEAGSGELISADPAALQEAFSSEADALARQVLVIAELPDSVTATEGNIEVTLPSGDTKLTASAFVPLRAAAPKPDDSNLSVATGGRFDLTLPPWAMYAGVGLLGASMIVIFVNLLPAKKSAEMSPDERVSKYTSMTTGIQQPGAEVSDREAALNQAKDAAAQMLGHNQSLEARISARLEAAGSGLKAPEWLLVHVGIMASAAMLGMLISKGNLILGFIFTALGFFLPWMFLGFKKNRRLKAFNSSLPDTLQLMAGSLQAGLSLAQSVDTIVREGAEPIASEFRRVIIETRLGVTLEDALEGITERFESKDFAWVVMAIKIQRQVGGNLAELLNTVAGTIREREYMRRQVAALAAEGKLSAYVLGGLPPAFLTYLLLVNRDYVMPMFTDPKGWVMLGGGALLLSVGIFWMSRLIKVEV